MFLLHNLIVVPKNIRLNSTRYFVIKIPNKRELQQTAFNHLSDIDFMNIYKKFTAKSYSFLVIDTILASDNSSRFRKNLLERIKKLIMTIDDKIKDKKLQYDITKEAEKYQHYYQAKLINMNFLLAMKYYHLIKVE